MAVVLTYSAGVPAVKVGRIAGQFAKPRSSPTETVGDVELPSFRGHIVNDIASTAAARVPDPERLLQAYHQSASTLNLLRAFTKGGFADLRQVHQWNQEFVASSRRGPALRALADEIDRALRFMKACGIDTDDPAQPPRGRLLHQPRGARSSATRRRSPGEDSLTGDWYDCSAHMLWIGERTRQLDGAHVEFLRGRRQPDRLQARPDGHARRGRSRCARRSTPTASPAGSRSSPGWAPTRIEDGLPPLLRAVRDAGHPVVWACDPMHGNTFTSDAGRKTRHFDAVLREIAGFFGAHRAGAPGPAASTSSSPATTSPSASAAPRRSSTRPRQPLRDDVRPPAQRPPVPRPRLPGRPSSSTRSDRRSPRPSTRPAGRGNVE